MVSIALAASLLAVEPAHACGGFFCNGGGGVQQVNPVEQTGEGIFFFLDEAAGTVEMHVQVEYQGPADEFAWIVPVPANPDLGIGLPALFDALERPSDASFSMQTQWRNCAWTDDGGTGTGTGAGTGTGTGTGTGGNSPGMSPPASVTVVAQQEVGPYETVTLQASDSSALIDWLQGHGFDIPGQLDPVLAPYVAQDSYFVALRLSKDSSVGDLQPLTLTYAGDQAAIPIQLTSIAAAEDMRLKVYIAGDHRAVPDSYLHVRLNELAVPWEDHIGVRVEDVVGAAADEAGGQAFFTDYAGSPVGGSRLSQLYVSSWDRAILDASSPLDLFQRIGSSGMPLDDTLLGLLADHAGILVDSVTDLDVIDALNCSLNQGNTWYYYQYGGSACDLDAIDALPIDLVAFAEEVELDYLGPRRDAYELVRNAAWLTRMTSTVSPSEMTVDPTFVFNPDMGPVAVTRRATLTYHCGGDHYARSPRSLRVPDGRVVRLPSLVERQEMGMTFDYQWLEAQGLTRPAAAIVEQTGAVGQPMVLVDNRQQLQNQLDVIGGNRRTDGAYGADGAGSGACACDAGTGPVGGWLAWLPLAAWVRRRARSRRAVD